MVGGRGYVLSWDALIALSIVLLVLVGFLSLPYFRSLRSGEIGFQQIHLKAEDAMETLSKEGKLTKIVSEWSKINYCGGWEDCQATGLVGASNMSKQLFDPLIPQKAGYMVLISDEVIYSTEWDQPYRPAENQSDDKTRSVRYVSGFGANQSDMGWAAKSYLTGNFTRHVRKLRYPGTGGEDLTIVYLVFNNESTEQVGYLVLPKTAQVINGALNLTWNTTVESVCQTN